MKRNDNKVRLRIWFIFILVTFIATLSACDSDSNAEEKDDSDNTIPEEMLPPVETNNPNSVYVPAFEGQTRINGVKTQSEYNISVIATGLSKPWGMTNLPDGRILLTEKAGAMRIIDALGNVSDAITGIPEVNSEGQGGLLDVAIDPDFIENRMVYWTFARNVNDGNATAVAKGRLSDDDTRIENATVIYTAYPEFDGVGHYGSRIAWDNDGNMFISTGERGSSSIRGKAQDLGAALGKVLHITKDGNAVSGGPFEFQAGALSEIFTYGHRNVQGLAIHPITNDVWILEMGPMGGDEVNLLTPGGNYGWPVISYGLEYSGNPVGQGITSQDGMEQPVYYWDPSVSPSGITFYKNGEMDEWNNNLFIGALSGRHIVRLVINNNRVVGEERLLEDEDERIRDVLQGTDGALYAISDGNNAKLYRIGL
ncbi:PQQ-dependent sugar dehydrogenase [Plebeiibacterium sediminum]|uniref:PQQ-dependent sugar dehydrogenase n=1 Tax=Plebeiibacterium sediminum TaxID=2992112 RepID=A0AAE3M4Q0_9BACT|nr:PQQ-dependent sugar dehydrogenase [Plebeiobacterium sediminum]MCW3786625.1 PQQ-dependent sugar dehydrogenase [Plebeiobacterium sediminum]